MVDFASLIHPTTQAPTCQNLYGSPLESMSTNSSELSNHGNLKHQRFFSLALHDLRVSENEVTVEKIKCILDKFGVPLTLHLVFDTPLDKSDILAKFLIEHHNNNQIEIVFHGLTHQCSRNVPGFLSFYHKYQAEYLEDSEQVRINTKASFVSLVKVLRSNLGICPPCWLASRKNLRFLKTMNPLYIELLFTIHHGNKKFFSPVISLGSPNEHEVVLLKWLARLVYTLSIVVLRMKIIRIVIHKCDLNNEHSLEFFRTIIDNIKRHRFESTLMKNLVLYRYRL